jgi:hypothetical protein
MSLCEIFKAVTMKFPTNTALYNYMYYSITGARHGMKCLMAMVLFAADVMIMTQCLSSNLQATIQPTLSCDLSSAAILFIAQSVVAISFPNLPDSVSGRQTDAPPTSCTNNTVVAPRSEDCVVGDVTDDVVSACATFVSCRVPSSNSYADKIRYSTSNCTLGGGLFYIKVLYDCMPGKRTRFHTASEGDLTCEGRGNKTG